MTNFNQQLDRDIEDLIKTLNTLPKELRGEVRKEILTEAAAPMVNAARQMAPVSDRMHHRYNTPKVSGKMRAPNGMGRIAASYMSGNLFKSIAVLEHGRFKKTSNVFIGPRVRKGAKGTYGLTEKKTDAYYAHMVEFGTAHSRPQPFMRPAFDMTKNTVLQLIEKGLKKKLDEWEAKNRK